VTDQTARLEAAVYSALNAFQQTADWPQLRLAQLRHHLAEHIARDVTLTPEAIPAERDEITAAELAHALDNSTPYPIELDRPVCEFMAERLLEMLTVGKRSEHPVWQPEEEPELGEQPQPEEPPAAPAVQAPAADRAARRERIAEAVRYYPGCTPLTDGACYRIADAVLAVLPAPVDRAADVPAAECNAQNRNYESGPRLCIRAAQHHGDHIDERGFHWSDTVAVYPVADGSFRTGVNRAELRRMADEAQPTQPDTAPPSPATEPWRGATELATDREIAARAATGMVGYRQGRGTLLHCLAHKPAPASRWADFHEVTAEDLEDGGICVHPRCGRDLLARWPAAVPPAGGASQPICKCPAEICQCGHHQPQQPKETRP
jgi:hypothetical protein